MATAKVVMDSELVQAFPLHCILIANQFRENSLKIE
jgi:hypothetical protein